MLDWIINLPLYGIALMLLGTVLYNGLKEGGEEDDE